MATSLRTTIQQMMATPDPFMSWDWELVIPRIPGIADSRQFTIRATATSIPGKLMEQLTWEGHGVKLRYGGKVSFDDTWEVTLIEARDMLTRTMMTTWIDFARSWEDNTGAYKEEYAVPASLTLLDSKGQGVRDIQLINCFPTQLGQATLDQGSGIVNYQCTFSFDLLREGPAEG